MLAVKGHVQTYTSPGWLAVQAGIVIVVLIVVLYLLSRPRLRRFNRQARRMMDGKDKRS